MKSISESNMTSDIFVIRYMGIYDMIFRPSKYVIWNPAKQSSIRQLIITKVITSDTNRILTIRIIILSFSSIQIHSYIGEVPKYPYHGALDVQIPPFSAFWYFSYRFYDNNFSILPENLNQRNPTEVCNIFQYLIQFFSEHKYLKLWLIYSQSIQNNSNLINNLGW